MALVTFKLDCQYDYKNDRFLIDPYWDINCCDFIQSCTNLDMALFGKLLTGQNDLFFTN